MKFRRPTQAHGTYVGGVAHLKGRTALLRPANHDGPEVLAQFDDRSARLVWLRMWCLRRYGVDTNRTIDTTPVAAVASTVDAARMCRTCCHDLLSTSEEAEGASVYCPGCHAKGGHAC